MLMIPYLLAIHQSRIPLASARRPPDALSDYGPAIYPKSNHKTTVMLLVDPPAVWSDQTVGDDRTRGSSQARAMSASTFKTTTASATTNTMPTIVGRS